MRADQSLFASRGRCRIGGAPLCDTCCWGLYRSWHWYLLLLSPVHALDSHFAWVARQHRHLLLLLLAPLPFLLRGLVRKTRRDEFHLRQVLHQLGGFGPLQRDRARRAVIWMRCH